MRNWVCIKCGSTATSKCPSQRSIFSGNELGYLNMVLSTDVVHGYKNRSEVFLNITTFKDGESDPQIIMTALDRILTDKDLLMASLCDHHYVINSETETVCSLGCSHHNLSNKEALLADYSKLERDVSPESIAADFAYLFRGYLETLRLMINTSKSSFDHHMEAQMESLKNRVVELVKTWGTGKPIEGPYRINFYEYGDDSLNYNLDFKCVDQAYMHYQGLMIQGIDKGINLRQLGTDGYFKELEPMRTVICKHCGKDVDITTDYATGPAHIKCAYQNIVDNTRITKKVYMPVPQNVGRDITVSYRMDEGYVLEDLNRLLANHDLQIYYSDRPDSILLQDVKHCEDRGMWNRKQGHSHYVMQLTITARKKDFKRIKEIFFAN